MHRKYKNKLESFNDKYEVVEELGCWVWTASILKVGYGCMRWDGKTQLSHRVSYDLHKGKIPDGMHVLHKCDNRFCVNPNHLFIGTNLDNIKDRLSKNRPKTGCVGEKSGRAILSEVDVNNIRAIKKYCKCTQQQLADIYNVSKSCINHAIHYNWKHI